MRIVSAVIMAVDNNPKPVSVARKTQYIVVWFNDIQDIVYGWVNIMNAMKNSLKTTKIVADATGGIGFAPPPPPCIC